MTELIEAKQFSYIYINFCPILYCITIACAPDYEGLAEIAHLPPKNQKCNILKQIFSWNSAFIKFQDSWGMQLENRLIAPLKSVLMLHANPSIAGVYGSIQLSQQAHLELCQMNPNNPDCLDTLLNPFALSNSTSGKYKTMLAVKH